MCRDHRIDETTIGWILCYKDRVVNSYLVSAKVTVNVNKGNPQQGILPPLLYCLLKDTLLSLLKDHGYYSQGFADDLSILLIDICLPTLSSLMQSALSLSLPSRVMV